MKLPPCDHDECPLTGCAHKTPNAKSVEQIPESREMQVVAAVTTGSLPVWSARLMALADTWDDRAGHDILEADWLRTRDSRRSAEYRDRAILYRSVAKELRTEIAAASVRQPEENNGDHADRSK